MTLPEPTFRSEWPDDEHAFCWCGGLMSPNSVGQLVCDDNCGTVAEDAAQIVDEVIR